MAKVYLVVVDLEKCMLLLMITSFLLTDYYYFILKELPYFLSSIICFYIFYHCTQLTGRSNIYEDCIHFENQV